LGLTFASGIPADLGNPLCKQCCGGEKYLEQLNYQIRVIPFKSEVAWQISNKIKPSLDHFF
jgi:hypothetical protein